MATCGKKIGIDPAVMAGPMVTTIVDIAGIAIYFGVIKLILL
ncbi:magnesium transporter [bacterium]|nr:magnesium transporter [bacterium]